MLNVSFQTMRTVQTLTICNLTGMRCLLLQSTDQHVMIIAMMHDAIIGVWCNHSSILTFGSSKNLRLTFEEPWKTLRKTFQDPSENLPRPFDRPSKTLGRPWGRPSEDLPRPFGRPSKTFGRPFEDLARSSKTFQRTTSRPPKTFLEASKSLRRPYYYACKIWSRLVKMHAVRPWEALRRVFQDPWKPWSKRSWQRKA